MVVSWTNPTILTTKYDNNSDIKDILVYENMTTFFYYLEFALSIMRFGINFLNIFRGLKTIWAPKRLDDRLMVLLNGKFSGITSPKTRSRCYRNKRLLSVHFIYVIANTILTIPPPGIMVIKI